MVKLPGKMRAVVQRVNSGSVKVRDQEVAGISKGLVVLLAVGKEDGEMDVRYMAEKIANLRIFDNEKGLPDKSVAEVGGEVLLVPQFTLYGDTRKGRRPSFEQAASPEVALRLFNQTADFLRDRGLKIKTGVFGQKMLVKIENDGPFTIIIDSPKKS